MGGGSSKKKSINTPIIPIPSTVETETSTAKSTKSAFDEVTVDAANAVNLLWKEKILWVFKKFDRDGSGALDGNEVLELMVEIQSVTDDPLVNSVKFSFEDSRMVLKALDADGNGTVEDEEFISWLSKGLAMDADQFERYMRSGEQQHQLATFLLGVKLYCEIVYISVEEQEAAAAAAAMAESNVNAASDTDSMPSISSETTEKKEVVALEETKIEDSDINASETSAVEIQETKEKEEKDEKKEEEKKEEKKEEEKKEEEKKSEPSAETPAEETSSVSVDEGEAVDATKVDAIEEKKDADVAW